MKGIIDTSSNTYRQIMGNGLRYEIPKFQRDYTWEIEQWDDLWQDLQALENNEEIEHYLGYLVMQTTDNKNFQIIDGQQRLTTISIIILATIKCLQSLCVKEIDKDKNLLRKDALMNSYIGYINPVTLMTNNKLRLNNNSDDYYCQYIVLLKELPVRKTNQSEKHLRDAFIWYKEKIEKQYKTGEQLAGFIDNFVDKIFFTIIKVTNELNAYKVFETLNARGVQLSPADLLKNYLFSIIDKSNSHSNEMDEVEKLWNTIISKLGEEKFEDYLRYYWNSYHKTVTKRNLFKEIKKEITTNEKTFELIRNLVDTADLYIALQSPHDEFWKSNGQKIVKYLSYLKMFQIKQTNSLFITAYKNLSFEDFLKIIKICTIISFRFNIIGGYNAKDQEEVYNSIAIKINNTKHFITKDFEKVYIDDDKFENDFTKKYFKISSKNNKIIKYILIEIENQKNNHALSLEDDNITLEHILPESADETWGNFTDEEKERSVYRLGNLTLLEKILNRDAGNLKYEEKINIYKKSNIKSTLAIVDHYDTWSEDKLSSRQQQMAKIAKSIWKIEI